MTDLLIRAVHRPLSIRIVAAVTTDLCREAARRHETSGAVACALGRGLTAGLLLSTLTKGGERVTVQILCDGPLSGLTVDAYDDGDVRGYPHAPRALPDQDVSRRQRLVDLVGRDGVVNVMRDVGLRERYQGQVRLRNGELDEDIEAYLRESEQIPSALGCEVVFGRDGAVHAAAGFLAQVMPGGSEDRIRELQHALRSGTLYDLLAANGADPAALAQHLMGDLQIEVLDQRGLRFRCRCDQKRVEGALMTLGAAELSEMIDEGKAEITCNFCRQAYTLDREALMRIRARVAPKETN
jgi:molecular chaperone Hsp33